MGIKIVIGDQDQDWACRLGLEIWIGIEIGDLLGLGLRIGD